MRQRPKALEGSRKKLFMFFLLNFRSPLKALSRVNNNNNSAPAMLIYFSFVNAFGGESYAIRT